jgi:5-methyltetrahydropteroyltriglutamate--homocysteine methyltransferase
MPKHLLPTTVVGSYPQPEWLVDRAMLSKVVPRTRMHAMWRLPEQHLEEAQDDATIVAIRDMERAGIDIVTDGEIRRESYSNRFATLKASISTISRSLCRGRDRKHRCRAWSAPSAAIVRSNYATWSFFAATPTARPRSRCRARSP